MNLPVGEMGKPAGQFICRPNHLLKVVNEPFAAAAIYPAVLAAWTYLALFDYPDWARVISPAIFVVGLMGILLYDQSLKPDSFLSSFLGRLKRRFPHRQPPAEEDAHAVTTRAPVP